jgi:hypothetical protein
MFAGLQALFRIFKVQNGWKADDDQIDLLVLQHLIQGPTDLDVWTAPIPRQRIDDLSG